MTDEAIILVEDLGKKYRLRHQQTERYTALRDVIADKAKALFRKRKTEKPNIGNSSKELTTDLRPLTSGASVSDSQRFSVSSKEDFWALRNVSFEVKRGEVLGIIGRNGAGKTTLLKILSRITEPTEGRVRIRGRVAALLEVGTGFHPELTGRENIFLNGAILGMSRAEIKRRFDEIVAFAETEKFLDTPVKRYSSGMYVRLAFAVAAHLEPEILVVDEVLAVGDAEFQKKCLGKMEKIARGDGRAILFVSHNMSAICTLCHRAILLDEGMKSYDGDSQSATNLYLSLATRSNKAKNGEVIREKRDPRQYSRAAILGVQIEDRAGNQLPVLHVNQPVIIRVRYSLPKPESSHTIMLQFSTADGTVVWTSETAPGVISSALGNETEGEITLLIQDICLYPKTYFIGAGIMNYGVGPVFWDRHFLSMTVVADFELPHQGFDPARLNSVVMSHRWLTDSPVSGERLSEQMP